MIEYIAAGNFILDTVRFPDGSGNDRSSVGGPATFAYTGIKIWTDNVMQCSKVGADYGQFMDEWVKKNNVETKGFKVTCDKCFTVTMTYGTKDGAPDRPDDASPNRLFVRGTVAEDFGFMKTSPEDIEYFTRGGGVKGIYLSQNCDRVFWDKIRAIKKRDGFKLMWELEGSIAFPEFLENIRYCAEVPDVFSLNIQEAERLFGVEGEEACIKELQKLPFELTLFRVGSRGLYSVTPDAAYYLPPAPCTVVDPTGCGNSSTGSALYAYAEGKNPLMVGIMANVASAKNICQYSVIPDMVGIRRECYDLADELYEKYSKEYNI